jgi:aldehyde dehydrogenase (NAD+)
MADALGSARTCGARVMAQNNRRDCNSDGYFLDPTVVVDVAADHALCRTEIFAPLLTVTAADNFDAALAIAGDGPYGLTASLFTRDLGRVLDAVDRLEVGVLHVNSETTGADPHVPFGGLKASGAGGRELGRAARQFYTETRTVYLTSPPRRHEEEDA